jgi:hypothetical protein
MRDRTCQQCQADRCDWEGNEDWRDCESGASLISLPSKVNHSGGVSRLTRQNVLLWLEHPF